MTKKQFLDAVNEIDDEFINELIDIPDSSRDNYFADDKPQVVYLTNDRVPFWKIAVSAATAVCVLTAGFFAAAKLHRIQFYDPNESAISESSITSASADESEKTSSERLGLLEREGVGGEFEFRILEGDQNPVFTDTVIKKDNEQYVTLEITCRGAVSLGVYRKGETQFCIGRTIVDGGTYTLFIEYVEEVKAGEELYLSVQALENAFAEGKWIP